ncbi:MAG: ATP-binding protein [Bacteroidales bacterium]|nr:ATP-binding protein [Bacteroidales bacterium]MCF8343651.1 ATP-binding protein [Bacteroidales bacterium]MCF8352151.1 ATP-binding protein [Bacteroidales bacterium]MCF8375169.1 ATP-binding protein [Bacteroidales bacterium]MCF8400709.1 ATP-binding protein [Bacteroidales bacterium]
MNKEVKITIPNDLSFVELLITAARKASVLLGFQESEIRQIELGLEEALTGIINNAFEAGEETTLDVIFSLERLGLGIKVREQGMPFDPGLIPEFSPEKFKEDLSENGLGIYLMKQFMDEYAFHNLGKEGKETRLFKYRQFDDLESLLDTEELEKAKNEREAETLPKGSVAYDVRLLKPEEAVDVAKCAYASYGYTYVHEAIYYPDKVREMNESGDLISFVAVKEDGEVIAHAAFEREDDRQVPQFGVAATKPRYRGQGCLNALNITMMEYAVEKQFMGVFGRGITTHPYSQKAMLKHGMLPCALLLSSGKERKYKGIQQKKLQRESVVLQFKYINPPDELLIFPPEKHKDLILQIYNDLGLKPETGQIDKAGTLPGGQSRLSAKTFSNSLTADISLLEYGNDVIKETAAQLKKLCMERTETIYLHLPLSDPFTALLTPEFEKMGFFFAGLMPASGKRDRLILQYLNNHVIDYDLLQLGCPEGERLKAYIMKEDMKTINENINQPE